MKIALCFSGKIGNSHGKSGNHDSEFKVLKKGFDHYKRHLIDKNMVDVFIHCWDKELETETRSLYKPVSATFEDQVYFDVPEYVKGDPNRKNNHYSRWYSNMQVNRMREEYEKKNDIKYDFVMTSRFDLSWETDIDFGDFDSDIFYAGNWSAVYDRYGNDVFKGGRGPLYDIIRQHSESTSMFKYGLKGYPHTEEGFLDLWFIANSENSSRFFNLFENLDEYNRPDACPTDKSGRISNHQLVKFHLERLDLLKKVEFKFHMFDDFPEVRRKYFGCRK